jgi:hypothetical protein
MKGRSKVKKLRRPAKKKTIPKELEKPTKEQRRKVDAEVIKLKERQQTVVGRISRFFRHKIVWTKPFDRIILLAITINCVFIALENPLLDEDDPETIMLDTVEKVFTVVFIGEMILKWLALGFFGYKKDYIVDPYGSTKIVNYTGYFLDTWNILDFVIVLSSSTSFVKTSSSNGNTSSIRILRVLRPLRTVAKIKELRILVETILKSMRGLADVLMLLSFMFIIFAIVGVQLFSGTLRQYCYFDVNPNFTADASDSKLYFKLPSQENVSDPYYNLTLFVDLDLLFDENYYDSMLYRDMDDEIYICNEVNTISGMCLNLDPIYDPTSNINMSSSLCLRNHENPDAQLTSFDNVLYSLLQVFVVVTLEGWVAIMYSVQATTHWSAFVFFYLITIVVSYFSVNLCIAVIEDVYSSTVKHESNVDNEEAVAEFVKKYMPAHKVRKGNAVQQFIDDVETALNPNDTNEGPALKALKKHKDVISKHVLNSSEGERKPSQSLIWIGPKSSKVDEQGNSEGISNQSTFEGTWVTNLNNKPLATVPFKSPVVTKGGGSGILHRERSFSLKRVTTEIDRDSISQYTIHMAKPQEELHMGKNIGHLVNDPFEEAQQQLIRRQEIALTAIAVIRTEPDPYFLRHRDNAYIMLNRRIAKSENFNHFVLSVIVMNTIVLAIYWPDISETTEDCLEYLNTIFTFFFTVEMGIKLVGLGVKAYLSDSWNVFDGLIVIVSDIEFISSLAASSKESGGAISAFRAFRLLRVLRLLGQFKSLRIILGSVISSAGDVSYLCFLLLLFIFMFATLGISLFSNGYHEYMEENPDLDFPSGRWRFDYIHNSMITVFQCITGDAWNVVMIDTKEATDMIAVTIYFVALVVFGGFIVLNLFVAILLSRMGSEDEDKWEMEASVALARKLSLHSSKKLQVDEAGQPKETTASIAYKRRKIVESLERRRFRKAQKRRQKKAKRGRNKNKMEGKSLGIFSIDNPFRIIVHRFVTYPAFDIVIDIIIVASCILLIFETPDQTDNRTFWIMNRAFTAIFVVEMGLKVIALGMLPYPLFSKVRWTMVPDDAFSEYSSCEYVTLDALAKIHKMDHNTLHPIDLHKRGLITKINTSSTGIVIVEWQTLTSLRLVFKGKELLAVYFLREPGVHVDAYVHEEEIIDPATKFSWHKWRITGDVDTEVDKICRTHNMSDRCNNSYFSSKWNQLDAFVVMISVLVLISPSKVLQGLRGIRPLRIAVRIQPIKVILSALVRAVPAMLNVFIFCFSFWLVLAILGMNWFSGQFQSCFCDGEKYGYGDNFTINNEFITLETRDDCLNASVVLGGDCNWADELYNFNDVFQSVHSLFVLATMSGWNDIMYNAIDTNGLGNLPHENEKPQVALYFVICIVVCAFFSLNLIISVVVDNFQRIKNEQDGSALMTEDQRKLVHTTRLVSRLGLKKPIIAPTTSWRYTTFTVVMHPLFEPLIIGCILLNTLTMCMEYYGAPKVYNNVLGGLDTFFVAMFTVEAILKIIGLGWFQYIRNGWNKFDFFIVVIGIISLFEFAGNASFNVLRLCRIGRVLRLINKAKTLRTLFLTLMYSLPSLWNIGLLLLVVHFVYAVVGMHLFKLKGDTSDWDIESYQASFQDFTLAFGTLFRISSGDGWTDVYARYLEEAESKTAVYIFFMSFFLLGALVMINLFIAVILDSFNEEKEAMAREKDLKMIKVWRTIWQRYDNESRGTLPAAQFIDILKHVPHPVGFLDHATFQQQLRGNVQKSSKRSSNNIESENYPNKSERRDTNSTCLDEIKADPDDKAVLDLLVRLKLFVEKKRAITESNLPEEWCVDYDDALLSYATMLAGPEIDVEPSPDAELESKSAAEWYAEEYNCGDILTEVMKSQIQQQRSKELAGYMMEAYLEENIDPDESLDDDIIFGSDISGSNDKLATSPFRQSMQSIVEVEGEAGEKQSIKRDSESHKYQAIELEKL